jgi:hypothetical protein
VKHARDGVVLPGSDLRADPGGAGSMDFEALPWNRVLKNQ